MRDVLSHILFVCFVQVNMMGFQTEVTEETSVSRGVEYIENYAKDFRNNINSLFPCVVVMCGSTSSAFKVIKKYRINSIH